MAGRTAVQNDSLADGKAEGAVLYSVSVNWMKKPMADGKQNGAERVEVALPSILRSPQGGRAVQIRNLSPHGVMIVGESGLAPDDAVELQLPNIGWVGARVAWSMDARAGLAFNSPIDLAAALGSGVAAC